MSIPTDRRYSAAHIWVQALDDSLIMGITAQAADALGDLERIELPDIGTRISGNLSCGSVESIKSVSDLIAPLNARVSEQNDAVLEEPSLVNDNPYEEGWLLRLDDYAPEAYQELLEADGYTRLVEED
jgi:glycine cleavage system H protein